MFDSVLVFFLRVIIHRLPSKNVCHVIHRYEVVDAHYFDLIVGACGTEHQTADTAETVDTNLNL